MSAQYDKVLHDIDALVDEQLDQYPDRSGYDHNVNQDKCPNPYCDADWHGLPVTAAMRRMRLYGGTVTPGYDYATDDSGVICPGSMHDGEWVEPRGHRLSTEESLLMSYSNGGLHPQASPELQQMYRSNLIHDPVQRLLDVVASAGCTGFAEGGPLPEITMPRGGVRWTVDEVESRPASEAIQDHQRCRPAAAEPRWWRIEGTREFIQEIGSSVHCFDDRRWIPDTEFEDVELIPDQFGMRYRYCRYIRNCRRHFEIHCVRPPSTGNWYPV